MDALGTSNVLKFRRTGADDICEYIARNMKVRQAPSMRRLPNSTIIV